MIFDAITPRERLFRLSPNVWQSKLALCFIAAAIMVALACGCTSSTEFGPCIGAFDNRKPDLEYRLSKWNTFLAIIFIETIIVPIWVIADEVQCPVARK